MDYAKHLIERIAAFDPDDVRHGVLSNELLREFHRGYSLNELRKLIRSDNPVLVATGAFITDELGVKCRPLLDDLAPLLNNPMKGVRLDALSCALWSLPQHGCLLAKAIALLDDPEEGVRWKAFDNLCRLSREQVEAANACAEVRTLGASHKDGLSWLLRTAPLSLARWNSRCGARIRSCEDMVPQRQFVCANKIEDHSSTRQLSRMLRSGNSPVAYSMTNAMGGFRGSGAGSSAD